MRGTRLIALVLGSTILALVVQGPAPANAQRGRTPYRVGVVNDARAANHPTVHGLKAGLRDLGLEEGRDVVYDIPAIDGDPARLAGAADAALSGRRSGCVRHSTAAVTLMELTASCITCRLRAGPAASGLAARGGGGVGAASRPEHQPAATCRPRDLNRHDDRARRH